VTRIVAARGALPAHRYTQDEITAQFAEIVLTDQARRPVLERLHRSSTIQTRHLVLPLDKYAMLEGFSEANDYFISSAVDLGTRAVQQALDAAGLSPSDVDVIVSTTVTGLAVPSLDARLVPLLGLRRDVRRVPLFGLGCVAGAAGIARTHDLLAGDPDGVAVLLSVELCSLTLQRDDESMANLVGSGLFGDGAAAVVLVGERRARSMGLVGDDGTDQAPEVVATRSTFYPDSERVMGWDIGSNGFRLVLDSTVAEVVEDNLAGDVSAFLGEHDLVIDDVAHWVAHPGGPKVLEAMQRSLGLDDSALALTWESLAAIGNLSSSSVLHVLADTLERSPAGSGNPAVMTAMGPGFCSEIVLLRW
jgi:alkylresorcinol/alkylpyrone synthase